MTQEYINIKLPVSKASVNAIDGVKIFTEDYVCHSKSTVDNYVNCWIENSITNPEHGFGGVLGGIGNCMCIIKARGRDLAIALEEGDNAKADELLVDLWKQTLYLKAFKEYQKANPTVQ